MTAMIPSFNRQVGNRNYEDFYTPPRQLHIPRTQLPSFSQESGETAMDDLITSESFHVLASQWITVVMMKDDLFLAIRWDNLKYEAI